MDRSSLSSRAHLRVAATAGHPAVLGPELFSSPTPTVSVLELLDAETRLLAHAVGDRLPLELALQVAQLRARRTALHGGS